MWKINDRRYSWAFYNSISQFSANAEFDLLLILKGYFHHEVDRSFLELRSTLPTNVNIVRYDDSVSPTRILFEIARQIDCDRFIFFTSWSRVLADGWLRFYLDTFEHADSCGIVGATGGYESLNETTPFPNVGIRSNAFMVARAQFVSLDCGDLSARLGGNLFEAGPKGMTKQIVARGFRPYVVDRFGKYWSVEEWPGSATFRSYNQERLLVSDNRTQNYEWANLRKRTALAIRNWGTDEFVVSDSLICRKHKKYTWNHPRGFKDVCEDISRPLRRIISHRA